MCEETNVNTGESMSDLCTESCPTSDCSRRQTRGSWRKQAKLLITITKHS